MTYLILVLALLGLIALGLVLWTTKLARESERLVPRQGKLHKVDGGEIHYLDLGPREAPVLVMIHGLGGVLQNFTYRLTPLLEKDFRLIVVDRPGSGYSSRDSEATAAPGAQGAMIGALLDDLSITDPVLVGHSLGGAVALAMALERADKTRALVLLAPLSHHPGDIPDMLKGLAIRSPALRWLISQTLAAPMAKLTAKKFFAEIFAPEQPPEDFFLGTGGPLAYRPASFRAASADLVAADDLMQAQAARYESELTTPGGVLFGDGDTVVDPEVHGRSMERYGLTYELLEGRGHVLPFTAPEQCAAFIRQIEAGSGAKSG